MFTIQLNNFTPDSKEVYRHCQINDIQLSGVHNKKIVWIIWWLEEHFQYFAFSIWILVICI